MTVMTPGKALAELANAREEIVTLTQYLNETDTRITALTEQLTSLKQQVEWFKRQMFGKKFHRQHQRLAASGIHVSRSYLKNLNKHSIDLLHPIAEAQWQSQNEVPTT